MSTFVSRFLKDESGATAIEYGLIAALIAVALVTAMGFLGTGLETSFGNIQAQLEKPLE
ncbi:Flp family type IVb pilin [Phenylobacterium sp.]|uniref:Flp family type IVb pilin n=1 Tax=Phenylobacterium sp. TaxID=1871053 RepID=UPI0028A05A81|nr:Flp family type IVb pilin [Phenylobacterium sp.]